MTSRSAAERGPGTVTATREQMIGTWLRLYGGTDTDVASDVGGLFDALAGATAAVPLDRAALAIDLLEALSALDGSKDVALDVTRPAIARNHLRAALARLSPDEEGGTP